MIQTGRALLFLLAAILLAASGYPPAQARELRRSMPHLRALLMGDAYVAVGDESSTLSYNPAIIPRLTDLTVEAFSIQFIADALTAGALLDPSGQSDKFTGLSQEQLAAEVGTSVYVRPTIRIPIIVSPELGTAYGLGLDSLSTLEVLEQAGQFSIRIEAFADQLVFYGVGTKLGDSLSVGATLKAINRIGIDKTLDQNTLLLSGFVDLSNDPTYSDFLSGEADMEPGLDLGLIFQFPGSTNWRPRIGISLLNLGDYDSEEGAQGMIFGRRRSDGTSTMGELPFNLTAGFAISPVYAGIRYTFAADLVDLTRDALEGDSLTNRSRVGIEIGIGPRKDGTALFSILTGWNATHLSVGVLSRVWVFELGFGQYTVEGGSEPGDLAQSRRAMLFGLRF